MTNTNILTGDGLPDVSFSFKAFESSCREYYPSVHGFQMQTVMTCNNLEDKNTVISFINDYNDFMEGEISEIMI